MDGFAVQLEGVADLRAQLRTFAPDLNKELQKTLGAQARQVAAAARQLIPADRPMSGWGRWKGDRLAWDSKRVRQGIKPSTARGRRTRDGVYSVVVVTQKDPAGAIFEVAGRTGQAGRFVVNLNRYGHASRAVWVAAETNRPQVEAAVRTAVDHAAAELGRRIAAGAMF